MYCHVWARFTKTMSNAERSLVTILNMLPSQTGNALGSICLIVHDSNIFGCKALTIQYCTMFKSGAGIVTKDVCPTRR